MARFRIWRNIAKTSFLYEGWGMNLPVELISATAIQARVQAMGQEIGAKIPPGPMTVIGVLRGAFIFMAGLVCPLERPGACGFLGGGRYRGAPGVSGGGGV